jgi:hypothetical protein
MNGTRALFYFTTFAACSPNSEGKPSQDSGDTGALGGLRNLQMPPGDPGEMGPYPIGIRTLQLPETAGFGQVYVEVWYPAAQPGELLSSYDFYGYQVPAAGFRDVPGDSTAISYLIVFSHGLGGVRQQNWSMAERLASHGFIVAAPDHPGTTTLDLIRGYDNLKEPLLKRPGTVIAAADLIFDGAAADLQPIGNTYGLIGHSLGAFTALFLGGAELDLEAYAEACAADDRPMQCDLIGPIEATPEELASIAPPDPRVWTTILQSPSGQFALKSDSLGEVPRPFIQAGDRDDPEGTALPTFALLPEGTKMALYEGGGHNGPTNICAIEAIATFSDDCQGPAAGFAEPDALRELTVRHAMAWMGATLGEQSAYSDYLGPGDGFEWSAK